MLGQQIRAERRTLRWTQAQLAERAGMARKTLMEIEQGSTRSTIGMVFDLAGVLGIPVVGASTPDGRAGIEARLAVLPARVRTPGGAVSDES